MGAVLDLLACEPSEPYWAGDDPLTGLQAEVSALAALDIAGVADDTLTEMLAGLSTIENRIAAQRLRVVAEIDRRGVAARNGARSTAAWVAQTCNLPAGKAAGEVSTATMLSSLPRTAGALAEGTINLDQVKRATRAAGELPSEAHAGLDDLVATNGQHVDANRLGAIVDDYSHRVDADTLAQREARAHERRRAALRRGDDGSLYLDGRWGPVDGEIIETAIRAHLAAPQAADDNRTYEQRVADAVTAVCRLAIVSGASPTVACEPAAATVTMDVSTYLGQDGAPPARGDYGGPLSAAAASLFACAGDLWTVVTNGPSEVLFAGRTRERPTRAQRKAVAARDGSCVGCGAGRPYCDVHHVVWRSDGGPTDVDNLVLLCWRCHGDVHAYRAVIIRHADGTFEFQRDRAPT
jgi:hypothetical protein